MGEKKYTQKGNNLNFSFDVSSIEKKRDDEIASTINYSEDANYDNQFVSIVDSKSEIFSHIAIIYACDIHDGAVGTNSIRDRKTLQFVKNTANALYVPGGDVFNAVIKADQDSHADKYGIQHAIDKKRQEYSEITGKIPFIIDGNHDGQNGSRWVVSGMSPAKHLADALNITHIKFGVLLRLQMPASDYQRENKTINIFMFHGAGKTSGKAKSVDKTFDMAMAQLRAMNIVPDVIFGGHYHSNANGVYPEKVLEYDNNGRLIHQKRKDVICVSDATIQSTSDYALAGGYPPGENNVYINDISIIKNEYFNSATKNVEYEYRVKMTRMPMFIGNEFTTEAKNYMARYQEPNISMDKENELSKLPFTKAVNSLKKEVKEFRSAKDMFEHIDEVQTLDNSVTKSKPSDDNMSDEGM